jgi:hypothetical protein
MVYWPILSTGCSEMIGTHLEYRLRYSNSCLITLQHAPHTPHLGQWTIAVFLVTSWCLQQTIFQYSTHRLLDTAVQVVNVRESSLGCDNETMTHLLWPAWKGIIMVLIVRIGCHETWCQNKSWCRWKNVSCLWFSLRALTISLPGWSQEIIHGFITTPLETFCDDDDLQQCLPVGTSLTSVGSIWSVLKCDYAVLIIFNFVFQAIPHYLWRPVLKICLFVVYCMHW